MVNKNQICAKCWNFNEKWVSGETYEGLDCHHNPPQFFADFLKKTWSGIYYNLCRKCHRKLHDEIIIILNKKARTMKFVKSEYWTLMKMNPKQIEEVEQEVYDFTKEWIKINDTKTITR